MDDKKDDFSYTPRRRVSERDNAPTQNTQNATPDPAAQATPAPQAQYDPSLPTIAALGGGLTSSRIVKQLPDDIKEKSLGEVIDYLVSPQVVSTKAETAVAESIKARKGGNDFRAVVNNYFNFHNTRLASEPATGFYQRKTRPGNGGTTAFNYLDLAVVSHDEGGLYGLEKLF